MGFWIAKKVSDYGGCIAEAIASRRYYWGVQCFRCYDNYLDAFFEFRGDADIYHYRLTMPDEDAAYRREASAMGDGPYPSPFQWWRAIGKFWIRRCSRADIGRTSCSLTHGQLITLLVPYWGWSPCTIISRRKWWKALAVLSLFRARFKSYRHTRPILVMRGGYEHSALASRGTDIHC